MKCKVREIGEQRMVCQTFASLSGLWNIIGSSVINATARQLKTECEI